MQLIERLYHPELAFLPIGDLYTMSPREAALACRMLNVRSVIPLHFGTFPAAHRHGPNNSPICFAIFRAPKCGRCEPGIPVQW